MDKAVTPLHVNPFKCQPLKMVKRIQNIRRQIVLKGIS